MEIEKVFTFLFIYYVGNGKYPHEITFCESTEEIARKLFDEWCAEEYSGMKISIATTQVVFNRWDNEAYGEIYGTPEEYYKG